MHSAKPPKAWQQKQKQANGDAAARNKNKGNTVMKTPHDRRNGNLERKNKKTKGLVRQNNSTTRRQPHTGKQRQKDPKAPTKNNNKMNRKRPKWRKYGSQRKQDAPSSRWPSQFLLQSLSRRGRIVSRLERTTSRTYPNTASQRHA